MFCCAYVYCYMFNYLTTYGFENMAALVSPVQTEQLPEQQLVPDLFDILPDPNAYLELNPEGLPGNILNELFPELLDPEFYVPVPVPQVRYFIW